MSSADGLGSVAGHLTGETAFGGGKANEVNGVPVVPGTPGAFEESADLGAVVVAAEEPKLNPELDLAKVALNGSEAGAPNDANDVVAGGLDEAAGASDFGLPNEKPELVDVVAGAANEENGLLGAAGVGAAGAVLGADVFSASFEVVEEKEGVKPPDKPLGVKPPVDGLKPPAVEAGLSAGGTNGVGVNPVGLNPPPPDEVVLPKDITLPPKLNPPAGAVGIADGG